MGLERRAHKRAAPGYQMLLGGHVGMEAIQFGRKATRLPLGGEPADDPHGGDARVLGREAGESFTTWLARVGGAEAIGAELAELDIFPTFEEDPSFYVDYDETGPYVAEVGVGECAGS